MTTTYSEFFGNRIMLPTIVKNFRNQRTELTLLNKAYGKMLVGCNLLDPRDYTRIAQGLDAVLATLTEDQLNGDMADLYFSMESALHAVIGEETARRLHLGRSRNDVYCALQRMEIRKSIWWIAEQLLVLQRTLLATARAHLRTVIPYYTYGQPAQPGTYAHYLVTLADMLNRDMNRLRAAHANTNRSPMGGAASIGTSFAIDKTAMAAMLGFDGVIDNTLDAVASFDFVLETETTVAILMNTLSRAAADLLFWASDECRLLDCDMAISGGSSIMPQKKNPAGVESVRAKSSHAAGLMLGGIMAMKNTTLFPVSDNFEMMFLYWEHMEQAVRALGMFDDVLHHSTILQETGWNRAHDSFTGATALAEFLTHRFGLSFVETHHVVGCMIRTLMERKALAIRNMTGELLRESALRVLGQPLELATEDISKALSPMQGLEAKVTGGTPSPDDTRILLEATTNRVDDHEQWLAAVRQRVEAAYASIDS